MQGKERNNREIDDQFVSQAWDSMKHLLDQEMPVIPDPVVQKERPNRRLPLLLMLLLLSFGAGAAWMYWYYHDSDPQPPNEEAPRAMLFETPTSDQNNIASIKTSESENKSTLNTSTQTNKDKSEIAPKARAPRTITITSPTRISSSSTDVNVLPQSSGIQFGWASPDGVPIQTQEAFPQDLQKKNTTIISVEKDGKSVKEWIPSLSPLNPENLSPTLANSDRIAKAAFMPLATISPIELFEEPNTEISPEFIEPVNKKWRLALEVAAVRDNGTKEFGNSFSVGTIIEKQLDNRFFIQSGVSWHHLNKRSNASKNAPNEVNSFSLDRDTLESFVLEDYYGNAVETGVLEILDYIKVPLQMSYKVNDRIRIHTGIHAAYLLSPIRLGNQQADFVPVGEKTSEEALEEARRTFVREGLKKIDFGVQVGMGIYPTERLGVFVNYNSGLLDFSDNEHFQFKEVHSNQYLQFGLVYYPFKR